MANFNEERPGAEPLEIVDERGYERVRVIPEDMKCVCCEKPTFWLAMSLDAPMCSHECVDLFWKEAVAKLRKQAELIRRVEEELSKEQEASPASQEGPGTPPEAPGEVFEAISESVEPQLKAFWYGNRGKMELN